MTASIRPPRAIAFTAAGLAAGGAAISAYLTITRLAGELPACGPLVGCEQVATSEYSEVFGIPVAVFGLGFSLVILGLILAWARSGRHLPALGAYGLGLIGIMVVGYLTYLELFVIHAVCAWCVAYAATVVLGWAVIAWAIRH